MQQIINLGLTILGTILKISSKNESFGAIVDGTLRVFDSIETDILTARKGQRLSEDIADQISESCLKILDYHFVDDARKDVIIEYVINTVNQANISYDLIFSKKVNAGELYKIFLSNSEKISKDFDTKENELFDRLLRHVSGIILNTVLESPQFTNHGIKFMVNCIENLQLKIDDILNKVEQIDKLVETKEYNAQKFERLYRNNIKDRYGWIQLLGANSLSREEKRYPLSIAYVTLEMARDYSLGDIIGVKELFANCKTIWIEGDAGSGKTTFLQWLAITSASNNAKEIPEMSNTIPVVVELRSQNCTKLSLKKAVENLMLDNDCAMPENWLSKYLETGKALILIDGVDEVKPVERDSVLNWIDELRYKFPNARIFITSRPQVDKHLEIDFDEVTILPMNRSKIDVFLDYWHRAVLIEKLGKEEAEVKEYKDKLSIKIDNTASIRRLVSNPLLCAMICALNYKNDTIVSTQRNELYDDCCKMLFGNRDMERNIRAYEHIKLSYEEKKIIFSQIAYWMMKNGLVVADSEDVVQCIRRAKKTLKPESQIYSEQDILNFFLNRCGILRTPEIDKIDFIHKSFQEYLAAFEVHRQDDWGFISSKAYNIEWFETLVLSMGFASAKNSQRVIKSILNGNDEKSIIVASACASNTSSLTTELRNIINSKLANIIPPKNIAESERLINAREFVIPLLRYNKEYTADENYFSLITLSRINSAQTLPIVVSHLHSSTEVRSILCISRILSDFTDSELQSAGILKEIQRYVYEAANTESLYLPESFLIYCEYGMSEAGKTALSNVKDLTLVQYTDTVRDSTLSLFSNVETLTIVGEFESFYALSLIGHNLKSVVMCDLSKTCDLYDILHYNLPSLEKFHFHSAKTFYIDGSGLDSIYHIKELGLFLYNNLCEVFFDKFSQFTNLHRLQIFSEFLEDLSYEPLILNVKPQELQLFLPDYTPVADQSSLSARLESLIRIARETKLTIRSFPYPFGKINE